jgi:hypothetical protein
LSSYGESLSPDANFGGNKMLESDKNSGTFTMSCDSCGNNEVFNTEGDWYAMLAEARLLKWRMFKENDVWRHYCPKCSWGLRV